MGIPLLLARLPGGAMSEQRKKFSSLSALGQRRKPVDIDCGSLVYTCFLHHEDSVRAGNPLPSTKEFFRRAIYIYHILQWDALFVFDGPSPPEKIHEIERRRKSRGDAFVDLLTLTAMCVKVCREQLLPFVVAPQEADMLYRVSYFDQIPIHPALRLS